MSCGLASVKQGDSVAWDFVWWEDDAQTTPLDLTGMTLRAAAQHQWGDHVEFHVLVTDAPAGKFSLSLSPSTTRTMPTGTWFADIRRELGVSVKKSTSTFNFVVEDSIVEQ